MAPRPTSKATTTTSKDGSSYIPPLSSLSDSERRSIKSNLLTEHFQFAPEQFARNGMDLANQTIYAATEIVEESLLTMTRPPEEEGDERPFVLDQDDVQKGVYRLETLLEAAVDKYFDLFELFALRNSFNLPSELIPYIVLKHQERIDDTLKNQDQPAIDEYEQEIALYEQALQKQKALACVEELGKRKLDKVMAIAMEIGQMSSAEPISSRVTALSSTLPLLQTRLNELLSTPLPSLQSTKPSSSEPWSSNRSAFINWASKSKIEQLGNNQVTKEEEDNTLSDLREGMKGVGTGEEASDLMKRL